MLAIVLLLSRVTGHPVVGPDGRGVGRLTDMTVRLDGNAAPLVVDRLVVSRRGAPTLLVPWAAVEVFDSGRVVLAGQAGSEVAATLAEALGPDEILLVRDVLDTQVVDVVGQRMARVADVLLGPAPGPRLEVCGVEVGFAGVLRRLGLHCNGIRQEVLAWSDLHLTSDRGHSVQLSAPRSAVHRLDAAGLAALVSRLDTEAATEVLAAEDPGMAAEAVSATHPEVGERVLRAMPGLHSARILAAMPAEYAGRWKQRLSDRSVLRGRRFLRSRAWPHRRHLIRRPRR